MSEIKFKLVDGEPVCNEGCPILGLRGKYDEGVLQYRNCGHRTIIGKTPCILGLRQQRDELKVKMGEVLIECQFIADESVGARHILGIIKAGRVTP